MAITAPTAGTVIESSDVEAMHEAVRDIVNNLGAGEVGIESLGWRQLPSIIHEFKLNKVTSTLVVATEPSPFNEDNNHVRTDWEQLIEFVMDNGGAGYTLPPCILVAFVSVEVGYLDDVSTGYDYQIWFNLHWVKDGAPDVEACDSVEICPRSNDVNRDTHQRVTMFKVMDYSGEAGDFTIDSVELWAALNRGVNGGATTPAVTLSCGTQGLIAFYRQS